MEILDGIVEWIAKQVINVLDLLSVSVLGAWDVTRARSCGIFLR